MKKFFKHTIRTINIEKKKIMALINEDYISIKKMNI